MNPLKSRKWKQQHFPVLNRELNWLQKQSKAVSWVDDGKHDGKTVLYWTPEQEIIYQGYPYLLPCHQLSHQKGQDISKVVGVATRYSL